jgi:hypothetical protein
MRKLLVGAAIMASVAGVSVGVSGAVLPFRAGDVSVTVTYTGKAKVDDTHEIWVFLFDNPAIDARARPVMVESLKKSGGTAVFKGVAPETVYVAVAYDEKGDYNGNSGPPPPGAPIGFHSTDGKGTPAPVKTTGGAKVKMSFGETRRMGSQ